MANNREDRRIREVAVVLIGELIGGCYLYSTVLVTGKGKQQQQQQIKLKEGDVLEWEEVARE